MKEREKKTEKKKKERELWDNFKCPNIHIIRISEEWGERDRKAFEEITLSKCQI